MANDFLFLCFSSGVTDNRGVGHFRRCVKIQQFVVLRRPFGCFMNPLAKQSRIGCFSEGTVFVVIDCGCPHENSSYQNPSRRVRSLAGFWSIFLDFLAQDEFIFTHGYPFKNMTHQKRVYSHFSSSIFVFFSNIHTKHTPLIALELSAHNMNTNSCTS